MILLVAATQPELAGASGLAGIETLACGVGPVEAAAAVAERLARTPSVQAVLHVGIAGARRECGLQPGNLVLGARSLYCDTASHLVVRELSADPLLLATLHRACEDAPVLAIGTSADVGGTSGCDVEAMEGFGVLRAAERAGVPAIEARTIANEIEEDDRSRWHFDVALDALAHATPVLVAALHHELGRP